MTETVYEREKSQGKVTHLLHRLPKNRKQIGQPGEAEPEVFIEDYAWMFGKGLSERDYTGCTAGVLLGEIITTESGKRIMVKGILEAEGAYKNDNVQFTEEIWSTIYRNAGQYFPQQEIVGWYLGGPGFLLAAEEKLKKVHIDHFGGDTKLLLKMDSIENEDGFYTYVNGALCELPGYYIYYDRNTEMQIYMINAKNMTLPEEADIPEDLATPQDNQQTKRNKMVMEKGSIYRLLYAAGGMVACLSILVIAGLVMQLKERETLRELLNEQSIGAMANVGAGEDPLSHGQTISPVPSSISDPLNTNPAQGTTGDGTTQSAGNTNQNTSPSSIPDATPTPTTEPVPTPTEAIRVMSLQREYIIEKGDTLASICMRFYGSVEILEELMRINELTDRDKIYAGQTIYLP